MDRRITKIIIDKGGAVLKMILNSGLSQENARQGSLEFSHRDRDLAVR
jgi:hypothetical protein